MTINFWRSAAEYLEKDLEVCWTRLVSASSPKTLQIVGVLI